MSWNLIHGQAPAIEQLRRQLRTERVAPAYLFVGPEGIGKRLAAFEFTKAMNCCQQTDDACDQCPSCQSLQRQVNPDLHTLAPKGAAAWIGIDDVRAVMGRLALRPYAARMQVAIVDGADRLTEEAANSFLKTLEEPSPHARILLLTSQPYRCLPTIRSRCQTITFQRLTPVAIEQVLRERQQDDPVRVRTISQLAQGSVARAMDVDKRWESYQAMLDHLQQDDPRAWIEWMPPQDRDELAQWVDVSIAWLRDVVLAGVGQEGSLGLTQAADAIVRQTARMSPQRCTDSVMRLVELSASMEQLISPRLIGALVRDEWIQLTRPS